MTIYSKDAINILPKIKELLSTLRCNQTYWDNLYNYTIQKALNSKISIIKMNDEELNSFQDEILSKHEIMWGS